jgi:cytochrome c oxidase assembly protein subunit 11
MTTLSPESKKRMKKQLIIMVALSIGMFGFCFALIPLYSVLCKITGLNGKTSGKVEQIESQIDKNRTITVELLSTLNASLPDDMSEFNPKTKKFMIHPGEMIHTTYWVKNLTGQPIVVQAIPSVSPGLAAAHIRKMECFCFQHQILSGLEGKEMPLVFTVDPALPSTIHTVTLAYTLFNVTPQGGA